MNFSNSSCTIEFSTYFIFIILLFYILESGNVDALKRELRSVRLDASEVDHALSVWSHVDH